MISTVAIAILGGLGGAIAGGTVSLLSQILARKWQKEDLTYQERKTLYSKISSIGHDYDSEEKFSEVSKNIGAALLICKKPLIIEFTKYMVLMADERVLMMNIKSKENDFLIKRKVEEVAIQSNKVIDLMRSELNIEY